MSIGIEISEKYVIMRLMKLEPTRITFKVVGISNGMRRIGFVYVASNGIELRCETLPKYDSEDKILYLPAIPSYDDMEIECKSEEYLAIEFAVDEYMRFAGLEGGFAGREIMIGGRRYMFSEIHGGDWEEG